MIKKVKTDTEACTKRRYDVLQQDLPCLVHRSTCVFGMRIRAFICLLKKQVKWCARIVVQNTSLNSLNMQ